MYRHTQKSPLAWLLIAVAAGLAAAGWLFRESPWATFACTIASLSIAATTCFVHHLTVTGDEKSLRIRFGPIPLFGKRIPYASIKSVAASRSRFIDGWGVHFVPGRGWTYNLWGFDCVLIERKGQSSIRVGTDDVAGLLKFLRTKVPPRV